MKGSAACGCWVNKTKVVDLRRTFRYIQVRPLEDEVMESRTKEVQLVFRFQFDVVLHDHVTVREHPDGLWAGGRARVVAVAPKHFGIRYDNHPGAVMRWIPKAAAIPD